MGELYRFSSKIRKQFLFAGLLVLATVASGQSLPQLRLQLQQARHDTTRLRLYCQLADSLRKKGNYDSLYVLVQKALPIAIGTHSAGYRGRLYSHLGKYYDKKGQLDKGIATLQQSLGYFRQTTDTLRYVQTLYTLATFYGGKSDYERAIKTSLDVLSTGTKINDRRLIGASYTLLIALYTDMHDTRAKAFYINQYVQFVAQENNPRELCNVLSLKAELLEDQHNYQAAWPYYQKALKIAYTLEPGNVNVRTYYLTETLLAMEKNLRHRKRYGEGELLLKKAIRMNEQISDLPGLVNVGNALALNYQQQGLKTNSLQAATQALAYARQINAPANILSVLPIMIAAQQANGYYREALATQTAYMTMKDSLLTKEKNDKIAQLQTSFDLEQKEKTIQLLHKNVQINQAKTKEQAQELALSNQQRLTLIISLGVLVPLLGIIAYFLHQARISQVQLARQKEQIEGQATQLQESNRFKDRLFSIIGHDLRSPVASLKSTITLARLRMASDKPVDLEELEQEVNTLQHTLDNMLYWSLNQQNGLRIHLQSVDLADFVSEVLEGFDGLIEHKQLTINFQPSSVPVRIDENLALIVLRNILHNAIKFTPEGRIISLYIQQHPASVDLIIADEGIGMNLSLAHKLPDRGGRGTGLGLSLSKELMAHAGGSLQIESQPGQGTTVTLNWPSATDQPIFSSGQHG